MPEGVLVVLRELERADEETGTALADLDRLAGDVDSVRARVDELEAFAARLPAEADVRAAELERSRAEASAAQRVLEEAEAAVLAAGPENAHEGERFRVRARDRASVADRRVAEATIEGHELHAHAREFAAELRGRPRIAEDAGKEPHPGLDGVEAWSEIARASLFVARGQLSAEREAVIRQANELGALALGEPLSAMGTGAVASRVEQALG